MYNNIKTILLSFTLCICTTSASFAQNTDFVFIEGDDKIGNLNSALTIFDDTEKFIAEKEAMEAEKQAELEKLQQKANSHAPAPVHVTLENISQEDNNIIYYMMNTNRALSVDQALRIVNAVNKYSAAYGVDKYTIYAIMEKESRFNPTIASNGSYGLMQLYHTAMPYMNITIDRALNIEDNVRAGVGALSTAYKTFGNEVTALSSYNWGSGNVSKGNYNTKYANSVLKGKARIVNSIR